MLIIPPPNPALLIAKRLVDSLTAVASISSATATVDLPAGSQAGDLAVLAVGPSGSINPAISGWTQIGTLIGGGGTYQAVYYKVLDAADITAGGVTVPTNATTRSIMLTVRPDKPISSVIIGSLNEESTAGNPAPQTIAASGASRAPVLLIAAFRCYGGFSASGSMITDGTQAATLNPDTSRMYYLIQNSTLTDKVADMADAQVSNSNNVHSFYLQVA
jgi:phage terminase large subunit-like protein